MTLLFMAAAAWPVYNDATGGTISTFTSGGLNYRRHVFTSAGSQTLTVVANPRPFTILVIGGGASGGGGFIGRVGGSGGGGGGFEATVTFSVGAQTGTVGGGGASVAYNETGNNGGSTSFASYVAGGGRRGYGGQAIQDGSNFLLPGLTGTPTPAADGGNTNGSFPGATLRNAYGLGSVGNGGGGGGQDGQPSVAGVSGAIVITYQIV